MCDSLCALDCRVSPWDIKRDNAAFVLDSHTKGHAEPYNQDLWGISFPVGKLSWDIEREFAFCAFDHTHKHDVWGTYSLFVCSREASSENVLRVAKETLDARKKQIKTLTITLKKLQVGKQGASDRAPLAGMGLSGSVDAGAGYARVRPYISTLLLHIHLDLPLIPCLCQSFSASLPASDSLSSSFPRLLPPPPPVSSFLGSFLPRSLSFSFSALVFLVR